MASPPAVRKALPPPTLAEPIPSLAGAPGLKLLRNTSPTKSRLPMAPDDVRALVAASREVVASISSATVSEVAAVLEGLALHFPAMRRDAWESRIVNLQWAEDLAGYPVDLLTEGARLWRNSDERFFPTPGQFKAAIEPIFNHRRTLARRAEAILAAQNEMENA